jgi:hypothetical protein
MCWYNVNPDYWVLKYYHAIRKVEKCHRIFAFPDFLCLSRILVSLIFSVNYISVFAGNQDDPAGGRSAGLSHASVTLQDGWSCFNNQAGLGYLKDPVCGFYFENRYNVKEFSTKSGFIAYPFHPGSVALSYRHFGYSKYYESKIGLAFGRKLAKRFAVGVQVNYLQTHIAEDYENYHSVAAEIGLLSEPMDNFYIGFHLFNPTKIKTENSLEQSLPTSIRFGFSYILEGKALLAVETVKDIYTKPMLRMGMELDTSEKLFARLGFTTVINHFSLGLGYSLKNCTADISFTDNQILGYTPQMSVMFRL